MDERTEDKITEEVVKEDNDVLMGEHEEGTPLTPEELNKVREILQKEYEENIEKNKDLKVLADLPSNNGVDYHEPEQGEMATATVSINAESGEKTVINTTDEVKEESIDDVLSDVSEDITSDLDDLVVDEEAVKKASETESMFGKFSISDETAIALIDIINKYKKHEKITYKILPEEVRKMIDDYMSSEGLLGHDAQTNGIRNSLADLLISEYVNTITMNQATDELNIGIEKIVKESKEELSPLLLDYNNTRDEYLAKITEKIEDEDKKKVAEQIMDSIHEAITLDKFSEEIKKIKVKPFDLEKPDRAFGPIHDKYDKSTRYNLYSLETVTKILDRHLKKNGYIEEDDDTSALKIMICFAKYCRNMDIEDPRYHAFLFYFTYNISMLDLYQNEQYDQYIESYFVNFKKVLENLR